MLRPQPEPRTAPRISVNDIARFMVSSDTARLGIVRRAKNPQMPPIMRYRDARTAICTFLSDPQRSVNHLVVAEGALQQRARDPAESSLRQDDARLSIEVLHATQRMANRVAEFDFMRAPAEQPKLNLAGVDISIRADLIVHGTQRGRDQIGAAILRMTIDDADTEAARGRRREMGIYVATLARLHVEQNFATEREVANRLCMSMDLQHGELFQAPDSNTRRMNDIENACRFIGAIWDQM